MADEDLPLSAEARFAEVLAELPAVERSVLALSEIGGLDTNEIAERLGTDPAIVLKLLARAREAVRVSLAARGRRGLSALLPFQSLWQIGSSVPALRAAGVAAAAAVIAVPSAVIGGTGGPGATHTAALHPDRAKFERSSRWTAVLSSLRERESACPPRRLPSPKGRPAEPSDRRPTPAWSARPRPRGRWRHGGTAAAPSQAGRRRRAQAAFAAALC